MAFILRDLGRQFGSRQPFITTFEDDGLLPSDSPFRRAWSYAEPTVLGMAAATMRLARDPYVIHTVPGILAESGRSLLDFFSEIYALNVAVVFGDSATAWHAEQVLAVVHDLHFSAADQPDWFARQVGGAHDFSIGEPRLQTAVVVAFASAIARAHQACGVLRDGAEAEQYCIDAGNSLGQVARVSVHAPNLRKLHELGDLYMRVPLMGPETLDEAGVPRLLNQLYGSELAPGVPFSTLAPRFTPLMWPEDRDTHGITFTDSDQERFNDWARKYAEKAGHHSMAASANGNVQFSDGEEVLDAGDFFTVSLGRVTYS